MDAFWDSIAAEPVLDKDLHNRHRLLVPGGDCYSVLCEHISHDQDIFPAIAASVKLGEVDGQYLEWSVGQQVSHEWIYSSMLAQGTALIGPDVLADILSHPWPVHLWAHQCQGVLNALMSRAVMEFLEHVWAETGWED